MKSCFLHFFSSPCLVKWAYETIISAYTLRYYEKKGLLCVSRDRVGSREYSEDDIERIKFIRCLKDTGMLICGIRERI